MYDEIVINRLRQNFGPLQSGNFNFARKHLGLHHAKQLLVPKRPAKNLGVEFCFSTKAKRDEMPVGFFC